MAKLAGAVAAVILGLIGPAVGHAEPIGLGIQPIIGYERVQKVRPNEHQTNRLIYGGRITLGVLLFSVETEYTRAKDEETFNDPPLTTRDTADKVKVGIRSGFRLGSVVRIIGRGGVQGKRNSHEEVVGGVTTKTTDPVTYKPYAGASLGLRLLRNFSLDGGVAVVFNDFPNMKKNDYETTLGFVIHLP